MALRDLVINSGPKPPPDLLAGLKERLRATTYRRPNGRSVKQLRNPDGPEAATVIELLQQQIHSAQGMAAPSGGETGTGSTEGNSPVAESHAPETRQDTPETPRQGANPHD